MPEEEEDDEDEDDRRPASLTPLRQEARSLGSPTRSPSVHSRQSTVEDNSQAAQRGKRRVADDSEDHEQRSEVHSEKRARVDAALKQRGARLFGFIKSTLNKAVEDTRKSEDLLKKRQEIQTTVKERIRKEKDDYERHARQERADRELQIRLTLQLDELKRLRDLQPFVEAQTRTLANFLCTKPGGLQIRYLPAKHNDKTRALLQTQRDEAEATLKTRVAELDSKVAETTADLEQVKQRRHQGSSDQQEHHERSRTSSSGADHAPPATSIVGAAASSDNLAPMDTNN
ncbi:hypothetical protein RI367_008390 [Sorochytrium milnesiophthora]